MATVNELIAQCFTRAGIRHVFGIPGGNSLPLMEACRKQDIDFVLTNHETAAGFMADAYSLMTSAPSVCLTTLGPGATNAVSAAAQAFLERSPVLFITAQLSARDFCDMTHQRVDTEELFRPVTKWSATFSPDNAVTAMNRAFTKMVTGRPGPVHLSLPANVGEADAVCETAKSDLSFPARFPPVGAPDDVQMQKAQDCLQASSRPVILAGLGVYRSWCRQSLVKLAEKKRIPVLYTPKIKGFFPEDSPWAVGSVGLGMAADKHMKRLLSKADLVIALGFDQVELVTGWRDAVPEETRLLWVDYAPPEDDLYHVDVPLIGDVDVGLQALTREDTQSTWTMQQIGEYRNRIKDTLVLNREEDRCGLHRRLEPHRVTQITREILDEDVVVTSDVGAQKLMNTQLWQSYLPKTFLLTNGFSSMGYGLPAAIGAAMAAEDNRPVVCFAGDGGFAMTAAEMETAVRRSLPVVVVVFDDESLSLIALKQKRRGYAKNGVSFAAKDYQALATGFGAAGYQVETEGQLKKALTEALSSGEPAIIGCSIEPSEYQKQI